MSNNAVGITANNVKGHVGQMILIKAFYAYNMVNDSDVKVNYVGYVDLSVDGQHIQEKISFSLTPNQSKMVKSQLIFFKYKAIRPGKFPISARIKVTDSSDSFEASSDALLEVTLT